MLNPGTVVDRYVVEAVAGRGGMGTVYRVRHESLGSVHALKVVERPVDGALERFRREAKAQAQLRHPNVVAVTDYVDVSGLPGLVMEYVDGPALDKLLNRGPLSYAIIDRLFADICAGVNAAHALNMVHRDLKPANVMVSEVDGHYVAKVGDFGIVKVFGDRAANPTLTRSESGMGTPGYMAPEQVFDAKRVDARADVYSLGCLLYRMLCGVGPFRGSVRTILANVARGHYPPPESHQPDLPHPYLVTIRACLEPVRDRRPANVAAIRELLLTPTPADGAGLPPIPAVELATYTITGKRQ